MKSSLTYTLNAQRRRCERTLTRASARNDAAAFAGKGSSGFALVETLVAIGLAAIALTALSMSAAQAIRIVKSGRETVNASEMLQQRMEALRVASQKYWASILTPASATDPRNVSNLLTSVSSAGADASAVTFNAANIRESYVIAAYPAGTPSFTVTVTNGAATVTGNAIPSTVKCVKLTGTATWTSLGRRTQTRTLSTILAKGAF